MVLTLAPLRPWAPAEAGASLPRKTNNYMNMSFWRSARISRALRSGPGKRGAGASAPTQEVRAGPRRPVLMQFLSWLVSQGAPGAAGLFFVADS